MISRSDIFKRAWALARMNREFANAKITDFGKWLKLAWKELKTGNTQFWSTKRPSKQERIEAAIHTLEMQTTLGTDGMDRLNDLRRQQRLAA